MIRFALVASLALAASASAQLRQDELSVHEYTLRNASGMVVRFIDLGATITSIEVVDRTGKRANVALSYGSAAEYKQRMRKAFFGATIGRYAGRIGAARFAIGGQTYRLDANLPPNTLHGGSGPGMYDKAWTVRPFRTGGVEGATLSYLSPDGEQGFPGQLSVQVTYRLLPDNALRIDYQARTTRPTVVNLTNHNYFNLGGAGTGLVTDHRLRIAATRYAELDATGVPTGKLLPVAGTPMDFRTEHRLGERMVAGTRPLTPRGGYDHGWVLANAPRKGPVPAVWLSDPASGRTLRIDTTETSVQGYTAEHLDGSDLDAQGRPLPARSGLALEMQHLPDSPNNPHFPTTRLNPGQVYRATTVWRFGVEPERR